MNSKLEAILKTASALRHFAGSYDMTEAARKDLIELASKMTDLANESLANENFDIVKDWGDYFLKQNSQHNFSLFCRDSLKCKVSYVNVSLEWVLTESEKDVQSFRIGD